MNKPNAMTFHGAVSPRLLPAVLIAAMPLLLLSSRSTTFAGSAKWKQNPVTTDWNTATNWTTGGPPNGPADTATFGLSNTTGLSLSASAEVSGFVFSPGASAFTVTSTPTHILTISGAGITNNSGVAQRFVVDQDESGDRSGIEFTNSATAGSATAFTLVGGKTFLYGSGGAAEFFDSSSADHGTFDIFGAEKDANSGGDVVFWDTSTGGHGTFIVHNGGGLDFTTNATAGHAIITNNGGIVIFAISANGGNCTIINNGSISFSYSSSAGHATITNNGDRFAGDTLGGSTGFGATATADSGTFINNGGTGSGAFGGRTNFSSGIPSATAANATLIANGGVNGGGGGLLTFDSNSDGGTTRVEVFGNGSLDISSHYAPSMTIGSLEGDGLVFLGANNLKIGSNNFSTTFSGVIQDGGRNGGAGGSLTKTGSGKLTLTKTNTYTGGTTISKGTLLVKNKTGSATGTGAVQVNGGTLGGTGTIAGAVTVGTGSGSKAVLSPGNGNQPRTFTIQSTLTFNSDATYKVQLKSTTAKADKVVANGVTINNAQFSFADLGSGTLTPGAVFTVISNTAATPIAGTFSNLADGSTFTNNGNSYKVNYQGGDGNDLTLKVVP